MEQFLWARLWLNFAPSAKLSFDIDTAGPAGGGGNARDFDKSCIFNDVMEKKQPNKTK